MNLIVLYLYSHEIVFVLYPKTHMYNITLNLQFIGTCSNRFINEQTSPLPFVLRYYINWNNSCMLQQFYFLTKTLHFDLFINNVVSNNHSFEYVRRISFFFYNILLLVFYFPYPLYILISHPDFTWKYILILTRPTLNLHRLINIVEADINFRNISEIQESYKN